MNKNQYQETESATAPEWSNPWDRLEIAEEIGDIYDAQTPDPADWPGDY